MERIDHTEPSPHTKDRASSPRQATQMPTHVHDVQVSSGAKNWAERVRHFTPSWFSVNMGTGIVPILIHNLPYTSSNSAGILDVGLALLFLNVALFLFFIGMTCLRYYRHPKYFKMMLFHPQQSLFLGTLPMGFATIINCGIFFGVASLDTDRGAALLWVLYAAWWIDSALALLVCFGVLYIMITKHTHQLDKMSAIWLLPIVACIVAAASGGIVAEALLPQYPSHAFVVIITSYILLGAGMPLAFNILILYFYRLIVHHIPPREIIVSSFLPLGPIGQGSFALMKLGQVASQISASYFPSSYGSIWAETSVMVSLVLWGYGLWWLILASVSIVANRFQGRIPFSMGWWGLTFPIGTLYLSILPMAQKKRSGRIKYRSLTIGVYSIATTSLGAILNSDFFRIFGTILSSLVFLLWLVVGCGTIKNAYLGTIFHAPCLDILNDG